MLQRIFAFIYNVEINKIISLMIKKGPMIEYTFKLKKMRKKK